MIKRLFFLPVATLLSCFGCNLATDDDGSNIREIYQLQEADDGRRDTSLSLRCGDSIDFVSEIWGSVGYSFDVRCDSSFFDISESMQYKHPDNIANGMCGGDEAMLTVRLKALKTGKTTVSCINSFRGQITKQVDYTVSVK